VEHPVTEKVTGIDLVKEQIRIAAGEPLRFRQEDLRILGHAIECRIYAEDASNGFQPSPGRVAELRWPAGVRIESGIVAGGEIAPFYDPMVAKLIVHAETRAAALDKASAALEGTVIIGLTSNVGFLGRVLSDPAVRANEVDTRYLDRHVQRYSSGASTALAPACAALMDLTAARPPGAGAWPWHAAAEFGVFDRVHLDGAAPWGAPRYWSDSTLVYAEILGARGVAVQVRCGDRTVLVEGLPDGSGLWTGRVDGMPWYGAEEGERLELQVAGDRATLLRYDQRNPAQASQGGAATANMPGVVVAVPVEVGERVATGATLAIVEAMKMENRLLASFDGRVSAIHCGVGDSVRAGDVLVSVDAD
jgi:propionyl-CoA carboxylase alpha chain/3-methylcrotonyl-CoA carboxylase alpha subunit